MRKRDKFKKAFKKASEGVISPYYEVKDIFKNYFGSQEPRQATPQVQTDQMHLRIRCFHAMDHAEIAKIYINGQRDVLQEFKINGVSSAKKSFWENDNTYIVVVEDVNTNNIVGGMRLDIGDENHSLPLEDAIHNLYPNISIRIHRFNYMIAETCALWVQKEYSERRLPMHITNACIAVATKLRIKVLVALVNDYSLKMALRSGFTIAKTVGDNGGKFFYPSPEYVSTVIELDAYALNTLEEGHKNLILNLRSNPKQTIIDEYKDYKTQIDYDLRIM